MTDGPTNSTRTQVAIVGAGPAGLLLAHMLQKRGVDSIAIDIRSRHEIETTHRAGILEDQNVQMLDAEGVSDRFKTVGYEHDGTELRLNGHGHRISFKELVGSTVWLYAQTEVFIDLANASERDGRVVHFGVSDVSVEDHQTDKPRVRFTDAEGRKQEIVADFLVGSDGSRSICRFLIPEERRKQYFVEYPFAWFGVTIEAKMSSDELIYATSTKGFALISQRSDTIQRWYLQAQPEDDMENWSDDQLFAAFDERVEGDGFQLVKGPITDKIRLPFRSFVQEPMQHGRLVLAGDAAHTVPPTGARGLNLAFSDVRFLCDRLVDAVKANDPDKLDGYERQALQRIWRAENFSYWMTQMMHAVPGENPFHTERRLAELEGIINIKAGQTYFAEGYCGWPNEGKV